MHLIIPHKFSTLLSILCAVITSLRRPHVVVVRDADDLGNLLAMLNLPCLPQLLLMVLLRLRRRPRLSLGAAPLGLGCFLLPGEEEADRLLDRLSRSPLPALFWIFLDFFDCLDCFGFFFVIFFGFFFCFGIFGFFWLFFDLFGVFVFFLDFLDFFGFFIGRSVGPLAFFWSWSVERRLQSHSFSCSCAQRS